MDSFVSVSHNGVSQTSYIYSPRGLRVKRVAADSTYFIYDLWGNVIYEVEDGEYREYVYAFGKHLARIDGDVDGMGVHTQTDIFYYHTNHIGTVEAITDSSGAIVWEASYTAFGEIISLGINNTLDQEPIFGGKTYDGDVELYYFNARWYDPTTGRFISEDPAQDGVNWYSYCLNNPLKYVDPTGLDPHGMTIEEADELGGLEEAAAIVREREKNDNNTTTYEGPTKEEIQAAKERKWYQRISDWWNGGWRENQLEDAGVDTNGLTDNAIKELFDSIIDVRDKYGVSFNNVVSTGQELFLIGELYSNSSSMATLVPQGVNPIEFAFVLATQSVFVSVNAQNASLINVTANITSGTSDLYDIVTLSGVSVLNNGVSLYSAPLVSHDAIPLVLSSNQISLGGANINIPRGQRYNDLSIVCTTSLIMSNNLGNLPSGILETEVILPSITLGGTL